MLVSALSRTRYYTSLQSEGTDAFICTRWASSSLLASGTIPAYYREVYDVVCPGNCTKLSKDVWMRCFETASVSDSTLEKVRRIRPRSVAVLSAWKATCACWDVSVEVFRSLIDPC